MIDLSDVLPANLTEEPGAQDWRPFVRRALASEGGPATDDAVARREALTRARVGDLLVSNLRQRSPLAGRPAGYDLVVSALCAGSATADLSTWALCIRRIAGLARPGGTLVVAALRQSRGCQVGGRLFPSANLGEPDLRRVLGPLTARLQVDVRLLPMQAHHGHGGVLLARGLMRAVSALPPPEGRPERLLRPRMDRAAGNEGLPTLGATGAAGRGSRARACRWCVSDGAGGIPEA